MAVVAALAWAALIAGAAQAKGGESTHCTAVRTNRFYKPAAKGLFGAFSIEAKGTSCGTARTVASKYVRNPFSVDSPAHRTKRVLGWTCTWRSDQKVSQQVSVQCTRTGDQIEFLDRLPNG
jgi:hypothetical protein